MSVFDAHRSTFFAALLALACAGCVESRVDSEASDDTDDEEASFAPSAGAGHFFKLQATKEANTGEYFATLPVEIWAPFTVDLTAGLFDSSHADLSGGSFDVDLDNPAPFDMSSQFHSMVVTPHAGGGLTVEAQSSLTMTNPVGTHDFPTASRLDFRFTVISGALHFQARAVGDPSFVDLGSVALPTQARPLIVGVGMIDVGHKTVIGFDHAHVPANGSPPTPPPDEEAAALAIGAVVIAHLDAFDLVDGAAPDLVTAAKLLGPTVADLDAARDLVDALPGSAAKTTAKHKLKAAKKLLAAALDAAGADKAGKTYKKLKKTLKDEMIAVCELTDG